MSKNQVTHEGPDLLNQPRTPETEKKIEAQKQALGAGPAEVMDATVVEEVGPCGGCGETQLCTRRDDGVWLCAECRAKPAPATPKSAKSAKKMDTEDAAKAVIVKHKYQPSKPLASKAGLKGLFASVEKDIALMLPQHLTPDRVLKAAIVATTKNKKLLQCTQLSVLKALMDASQLGLDCSGVLGAGYLVPYKTECVFIPGYRGLISLARRSGEIVSISAYPVYEQDRFELRLGTDNTIEHVPYMKADRKEQYVCFYAVAKLRDGSVQVEMMTQADVKKIQKLSKIGSRSDSPWVLHYSEMGRKSVVKRLCKYLPLSADLERALHLDNTVDPIDVQVIDQDDVQSQSGSDALAASLGGTQ